VASIAFVEVIPISQSNLPDFCIHYKLRVMASSAPSRPGLRESNKARTRQAISDVATRLFIAHGFEQVTVAQIAAKAQVSVKTVFNYFSSKEDLFFDRADDVVDVLVDAVIQRPAGTTITEALRTVLGDRRVPFDQDGWKALRSPKGYEGFRSFVATEHASPVLRARRLVLAEGWIERLAEAFARELGLRAGDRRARTLAAMVVAAMGLRERTLSASLLERAGAATVERRVRAVVDEAFGRIARAFEDLDRPRD
jgi:AcrR family transcriptional regulator